MMVGDVHPALHRSCFRDGVKVYRIFVDEANRLQKRFIRSDGLVDENARGAYVLGSDGLY
jgi:hypothetical protein